jgi:hypothetical protein
LLRRLVARPWRFHKIHHSDKSFHVTTGLRFHVFDQLLEVVVECICVILIGVSAQIVIVCEVLRMAFVFFHHSNLSFPGEKWLSYIIITPYLHRAHHSTVREEHDSNYGIVLSVWDLMFETRKELIPNTVGLEMIEANDLVQLFCLAFVTERRLARLLHYLPRRRRRGSELPIGLSHKVQPKPTLVSRPFRTGSRRQRQKLGRSPCQDARARVP